MGFVLSAAHALVAQLTLVGSSQSLYRGIEVVGTLPFDD